MVMCFIISELFFSSWIGMIVMVPGVKLFLGKIHKKRYEETLKNMKQEFASALDSMAGALNAGYSFSNSIYEVVCDLKKLYGTKSEIYKDFCGIYNKISLNRSIDEVFYEYGRRHQLEEVRYFCDVICITRKEGGNMVGVIKQVKSMLYEKIELERNIQIMCAAKKSEAMIMAIMPAGMLLYFKIFSPDFIDGMYGNLLGIIVMAIVLIVYVLLVVLIDKISKIKI